MQLRVGICWGLASKSFRLWLNHSSKQLSRKLKQWSHNFRVFLKVISLLQDFLKGITISCENLKTLPRCLLQTRENTFFPPKAHLSPKSEQAWWHVYIWGGGGGGGGSIINAREDCLGTALFCWETQHLKSPGVTFMQKRCCHADELWLVGKQVQERSLQITLSLNLVLRKTKAASGISAKKKMEM